MEDKYIEYKQQFLNKQKQLQRRSTLLGLLKFALLMIFCVFLWKGIQTGYPLYSLIGMGAAIVCSIPAWIYHSNITTNINKCKRKAEIVETYISRIHGKWLDFPQRGDEYVDYQHPYSFDLDIFGQKSLFQFLNTAGTMHGKEQLRQDLADPQYTVEEIRVRQSGIAELGQPEYDMLRFEVQYHTGSMQENEKLDELVDILTGNRRFIKQAWQQYLFKGLPVLTILVSVLAFFINTQPLRIAAVALIGLQILLWMAFSIKTYGYLRSIQDAKHALEEYETLFALISRQPFQSPLLKEIQAKLNGASAGKAIKRLDGIVQRISLRGNALLYIIFNTLFLWDINCSLSLEKWKLQYAPHLRPWLKALGDFESLMSLSVLNRTITGLSFPVPVQEENVVRAVKIGHPLIENQIRVCNDFIIQNDIYVISGSNMSGKTTFLRTVGINLVLAKAGAAVCAEQMSFSDMRVMTSMRIIDDLHDGISTFYAELKRIKTIVAYAREDHRLLFLIDEIFRGTNSQDRTEGAKAVMAQLAKNGATGLLTTHDLKLCESTEEVKLKNYHFAERYENEKLIFDYKIKPGIAKTTNGRYLMQMLGLITK